MARINLRDYLKGIEELIDGGQTEEALAHCRHILITYPKHVDTYRMMGKAYLEAKQHSEAGDIFQRVLSSVPDDFVAHIGMSIIREDEGNQDAAIWHMERAFESQPSNRAVQDELRRLYGKREGYELPKVRLTRGALARMYAHGDLYNQAISELRGALSEDSQRPDLQVLLTEMYFNTKRETDAIDVCSKLIEQLPYCLVANRIMSEVLRRSQKAVEAEPYQERVEELDPYAAQADWSTPVETVPAESVMIDQLELQTRRAQDVPRSWTASLQMPAGQGFEKEELPEWLSADVGAEAKEDVEEEEETEPQDSVLGSLYGLDPTPTGELPEIDEQPKKPTTAAFVDDRIPDWLRELRPATGSISLPEEPQPEMEFEEKSWTGDLKPGDQEEPDERPLPQVSAFEEGVPAEKIEAPPLNEEEQENLSWLEGLAAKQGTAEEELLTKPEERAEAQPEFLEAEKPKSDALAWLDELGEESTIPEEAAPSEESFTPEPETTPAFDTEPEIESTTPTWLRDLSVAAEEAPAAEPVAPRPLDEAPDWLQELRPPAEEVEAESEEAELEVDAALPGSDQLDKLDWLEEDSTPAPRDLPSESVWVPEAGTSGDGGARETPPVPQAPAVDRRSARLKTMDLAPGVLEQARQALNYGKLSDAADHYGYLLRRRVMLEEVVADLSAAVHRHPQDVTLWQTLGDAYMRNNQLREALDCYTKAKDLL